MHLKILLVPFLIVLVLVLAIGFIQPDILLIQEKKLAIQTKEAHANSIETILGNISLISDSLDSAPATENFVQNYLPKAMDQERVIDALNFSALQSGVLVESMEVIQPAEQAVLMQTNAAGEEVPMGMALNPDGTPVLSGPVSKTFSTKIVVKGSYENIKNFVAQAAHMDRFYVLKGFSVGLTQQDMDSQTPNVTSGLEGTFYADFDYLKTQKTNSALSNDVFSRSNMDFSSLQSITDWVTNRVPLLEKPTTGKPNPFQ